MISSQPILLGIDFEDFIRSKHTFMTFFLNEDLKEMDSRTNCYKDELGDA